jgi:hypothetical protein
MLSLALILLLSAATAPHQNTAPEPPVAPGAAIELEPIDVARALLPSDFKQHTTRHWILLSDARWDTIDHVGRHLEAAMHQFSRLCRMLGAARTMPSDPMLCIVFSDAEEFREFAKDGDDLNVDPLEIGGYFSPSSKWILFYEPHGQPELQAALERLDQHEAELQEQKSQAPTDREDPRTRQQREDILDEHARNLAEHRSQLEELETDIQTAVTVHEAFHQLAWLTEFSDHRGGWRLWLHEGFATTFETRDTSKSFGPWQESEHWRSQFKLALHNNQVVPLRRLLFIKDISELEPDELGPVYAQSYSLVRWLWRFHRTRLNEYLRALREHSDYIFPQDDLRAFEDAFGPVDTIERRWLRDEADGWAD